jgi:hypothetical protein
MTGRQSWEEAAASMTPASQLSALYGELAAAEMMLQLSPKSRRWRRYRADVLAAIAPILAADPIPPEIAAMSDDDLLRELSA